ncbi:MAG: PAS domain S-box protein, partial [Acidovorax sp.]|nr:PAS domain S-box protein [Acidovorax sp.]
MTAISLVVALTVLVPPALLPWTETASALAAQGGSAPWQGIPWRYAFGVVTLCGAVELLRARARSLQTLGQHEDELLRVLKASGGGRWEWDLRNSRFTYHGRFYRAFGLANSPDDEDFTPLRAFDVRESWQRCNARRHPDDRERLGAYLQRVQDGLEESFHAESRMRDDEGHWRWVVSRGHAVERDSAGRVLRMAGIDLDITEHHEMRDALRVSEAKYTTVYQTLPDAAGITRLSDGCYLDVNPAFERLLGKPRDQILGRSSMELGVWGDTQERARLTEALRNQGEVRGLPMTALRDGAEVPGLMSGRVSRIKGEDCLVFVFHDMTQERRVRDELLAANRLLRQAGWMARLGVWEEEPGKGITYWSDVCFDIH